MPAAPAVKRRKAAAKVPRNTSSLINKWAAVRKDMVSTRTHPAGIPSMENVTMT